MGISSVAAARRWLSEIGIECRPSVKHHKGGIHRVIAGVPHKRCPRCATWWTHENFNKQADRPDGLRCYCRPCDRAHMREIGSKANIKAMRSRWAKSAHGRSQIQRYRERYPQKKRAQTDVLNALRRGELVRPDRCSNCGEAKRIEAHHDDYARPLDVRWLCRLCHRSWHSDHGHGLNSTLRNA